MKNFLWLSVLGLSSVAYAADPDWAVWRGPRRDGTAGQGVRVPLEWSETRNVKWSAAVPGRGHASPIVSGGRIFIATSHETAGSQSMLCYKLADGSLLWSKELHRGSLVHVHKKNSQASLTPACDGKRVYAMFVIDDALHVTAMDLDGKIIWQKNLGKYLSEHGHGAAVVLHESMLMISGEDHTGGYLAAMNGADGAVIWQIPRQKSGKHANYATPAVGTIAGRKQLLIHGYDQIASYDPSTGKTLWTCSGPTVACANTPLFDDRFVYASGGYPGKQLICVRADGTGDVTASHVKWTDGQGVAYVPSSILHKGRLYVVNDGGIATCYDTADGRVIWRERLGGDFSASPVLVNGKLYFCSEAGVTTVVEASDTFNRLAENRLPGGFMASPAVVGNQLLLRTSDRLYCIGE